MKKFTGQFHTEVNPKIVFCMLKIPSETLLDRGKVG